MTKDCPVYKELVLAIENHDVAEDYELDSKLIEAIAVALYDYSNALAEDAMLRKQAAKKQMRIEVGRINKKAKGLSADLLKFLNNPYYAESLADQYHHFQLRQSDTCLLMHANGKGSVDVLQAKLETQTGNPLLGLMQLAIDVSSLAEATIHDLPQAANLPTFSVGAGDKGIAPVVQTLYQLVNEIVPQETGKNTRFQIIGDLLSVIDIHLDLLTLQNYYNRSQK